MSHEGIDQAFWKCEDNSLNDIHVDIEGVLWRDPILHLFMIKNYNWGHRPNPLHGVEFGPKFDNSFLTWNFNQTTV